MYTSMKSSKKGFTDSFDKHVSVEVSFITEQKLCNWANIVMLRFIWSEGGENCPDC